MSVSMDRGQFCSSVCVLLLLLSPCWGELYFAVRITELYNSVVKISYYYDLLPFSKQ